MNTAAVESGQFERLSASERELLLERLTSSLDRVRSFCERSSGAQWSRKPGSDAWSAAECIEHLILSEESLLGLIQNQLLRSEPDRSLPQAVAGKDGQIVTGLLDRSNRLQTFDFLKPAGRWTTQKDALDAFLQRREQTIDYVRTTEDPLHVHGSSFGALGMLDAYQWLLAIAVHTERHVAQAENAIAVASSIMQTDRTEIIAVVEGYLNGLGRRDFTQTPFASDFTYESPLLPALVGQPSLSGDAAIRFLESLFPAIVGIEIRQHVVEGEYCVSNFDFHTVHGVIPVLDRFRVVNGLLELANPFYDPTPILQAAGRSRREQLRKTAEAYFTALQHVDFAAFPFSDDVRFRAPLAPGGVHSPVIGRQQLEQIWWPPLKGAISRVEIVDHYINEEATSICTAALVSVAGTDIVLRVADRFTIDNAGLIIEQENHFDPRDLTNPGWASQERS